MRGADPPTVRVRAALVEVERAVDATIAHNAEDLLTRARSGDLRAFAALVEQTQERAVRVAYGLVGSWEDARDLSQDAYVKAYEHLDRFDGRSGFYTWYYRILTNTCRDHLRRRRLVSFLPLVHRKSPDGPEETHEIEDRAGSSDPVRAAQGRETLRGLRAAVERLPERQRAVFVLRYLEEMALEEIAGTLELSIGTVKAHLWQATRKVRELLQRNGIVTEGD